MLAALAFALAVAPSVRCAPLPQDPAPRPAPEASGNLLLTGATIFTGTHTDWPGALATQAGRITAGGTLDPAIDARHVDLPAGAFVMPGLQDAHGHLAGLGDLLAQLDLVGTGSWVEVVDRVRAVAARVPAGTWIIGRGWDQNDWPQGQRTMPHHRELSAAVPDHPVWLTRIDGHAGIANRMALAAAGIDATSTSRSGGEIQFDDAGEPTGVLVDAAMAAIVTPPLTAAQRRERLLAAHDACLRHGLTCVHDAGVGAEELDAMLALHAEGRWKLRTYVMLHPHERTLIERGPWQTSDGLVVVRAVKAYADGALGSRGAVLLAPYADRPAWKGLMLQPKAALVELGQRCADHGMQLCVHAIGDAANRTVLDAFAALRVDGGIAPLRFRIEHAQIVAPADVVRFARLGVLPAMQPTHLTSDMPWAAERLGPERVLHAYAWRAFHRLGVVVPFGSDFPVESVDPRHGLFAAVTTRGVHGGPPDGYRPDQRLSREQALRGFTLHAAHGMHAERRLGTIEVGKTADLTVFDRDLRTCPDAELLDAKVLLTIVGGQIVFDGR